MKRSGMLKCKTMVFLVAGMLVATPALADKPAWAGGHKNDQNGMQEKHGGNKHKERRDRFSEQSRSYLHEYYGKQFSRGHCPPGLARKNNGCMPPGQAKKWKVGQPLPRDVVYYDLPRRVATRIGPPPAGHRYVRVANDILLIAVGTGMVMDAVEDLGQK